MSTFIFEQAQQENICLSNFVEEIINFFGDKCLDARLHRLLSNFVEEITVFAETVHISESLYIVSCK